MVQEGRSSRMADFPNVLKDISPYPWGKCRGVGKDPLCGGFVPVDVINDIGGLASEVDWVGRTPPPDIAIPGDNRPVVWVYANGDVYDGDWVKVKKGNKFIWLEQGEDTILFNYFPPSCRGLVYYGRQKGGLLNGKGKTVWLENSEVWRTNRFPDSAIAVKRKKVPFNNYGEYSGSYRQGKSRVTIKGGETRMVKWNKSKLVGMWENCNIFDPSDDEPPIVSAVVDVCDVSSGASGGDSSCVSIKSSCGSSSSSDCDGDGDGRSRRKGQHGVAPIVPAAIDIDPPPSASRSSNGSVSDFAIDAAASVLTTSSSSSSFSSSSSSSSCPPSSSSPSSSSPAPDRLVIQHLLLANRMYSEGHLTREERNRACFLRTNGGEDDRLVVTELEEASRAHTDGVLTTEIFRTAKRQRLGL